MQNTEGSNPFSPLPEPLTSGEEVPGWKKTISAN